MALIVQKYGGSSIASPAALKRVAARVAAAHAGGDSLVVVVSAMGDSTDNLLSLMGQITPQPPKRELDLLLSTGEVVSAALLAAALDELGRPAIAFTAYQGGIITDNVHTKARIKRIDTIMMRRELRQGNILVVAGFQGVTSQKLVTTLGRGGSDTTAVALAAALKADICEIYSDVEGVFTADPRLVPNACKLKRISYEEMLELASLGTKVLHLRAVEIARKFEIPLHIRSSFLQEAGTLVCPIHQGSPQKE